MLGIPAPRAHLQCIRGISLEGSIEVGKNSASTFEIDIDGRTTVEIDLGNVDLGFETETRVPFRTALPQWVFDGQEHSFSATCDAPSAKKFLFQSRYFGRLDGWNHHTIHGWCVDLARLGASLSVDIFIDGERAGRTRADVFRDDLQQAGYSSGDHGFTFLIPPGFRTNNSSNIEIAISGQTVLIADDPLLVVDSAGYLNLVDGMKAGIRQVLSRAELEGERSLSKLLATMSADQAKVLLQRLIGGGTLSDLMYLERRFNLLDLQQGPRTFSADSSTPHNLGSRWPAQRPASQPVDVIVPIYKGIDETIQCLRSVLDSSNVTPYELICILDSPDDRAMTEAVQHLASVTADRKVRIVTNPGNAGFVVSANRGMQVHPDRDVVLLNSDTVVDRNWLDRLRRAAYSSPEIGTVTPFSNNATICSYPHFLRSNELHDDCDARELDRICEEVNPFGVVDIPTAVGFCMYIRRNCVDKVGLFDEKSFGRGYGEENDFSRRAAQRGWRNVLAADTFVRHLGGVSFGLEKLELEARNSKILDALHPRYQDRIASFFENDPVRPARRRMDVARLRRFPVPLFCFITHDFGGGTGAYVRRLGQGLIEEGISPLVIECSRNGRIQLKFPQASIPAHTFGDSLPNLIYHLPAEFEELVADLSRLSIQHFHFQTNINVADEMLTLPARLGVEYDCTAHDYSWVCPRINLVDDGLKYCGEPPVEVCERCIQLFHANPDWDFDRSSATPVRDLRHHSAAFLRNARRVFCASNDLKLRMEKYFPDGRFVLTPHEHRLLLFQSLAVRPVPDQPLSVVVFGELSIHKGSEVLRKCAFDAWKRSLPLRFVLIGYTNDDENFEKLPNVVITGKYSNQDVPDLVREHKVTLSFFPAVCPETFSYTLSIALRHGLFPIAFDLGAIAERIRQTGFGHLLPLAAADFPQLVNAALLEHADWMDTHSPANLSDTTYPNVLRDYYGLPIGHNS